MKRSRTKTAAERSHGLGEVQAKSSSVATVLHIDDDPNDSELFQAAARRANVQFSVHTVTDGEQAMAYFNGRGVYANRQLYPLPALVLLDLKMPRATGFEVLGWIRKHSEVGNVPVVVFSGSELQDDIRRAYAVGADSYMVKPIGFNALVNLVKDLNASLVIGKGLSIPALASTVLGATDVFEGVRQAERARP
jgi:CheY-like chemotaxis protein